MVIGAGRRCCIGELVLALYWRCISVHVHSVYIYCTTFVTIQLFTCSNVYQTFVVALDLSRLDYGNAVLVGLSGYP